MTNPCPSCRVALPGGCSTCRPMPIIRGEIVKPIIRGESSLSALVGAIARHHRSDSEWKRDVFIPTPEVQ